MDFLIGDVQGCDAALQRLLTDIGFSPSRDHVTVVGDLVNRGPASRAVIERLRMLGSAATCLLGNHDLHLLAVATGVRRAHRNDTVADVLDHPQRDALLDWLRQRPLAAQASGWLLVHAGVPPQWDEALTLALAGEIEQGLRGPDLAGFLHQLFGNEPSLWRDDLPGSERLRFAINALTRTRFCHPDGRLDFEHKGAPGSAPAPLLPWFEVANRRTEGTPIAFGHWSTLGLVNRPDLLSLDTGCAWGEHLTAVRIDGGRREVIQVDCSDD